MPQLIEKVEMIEGESQTNIRSRSFILFMDFLCPNDYPFLK